MPAIVNYSGDDEFYSGGSFCPNRMDSGGLFSVGSHVDYQTSPSKRARISAHLGNKGCYHKQDELSLIEALPDECLIEIFGRLEGARERSMCAFVSKKWLTLLSSMRKEEISKTKCTKQLNDFVYVDVEMASASDSEEFGDDGFLTRCLEGKRATDVRLASIVVGTSSRGGLGKLSIRGNNSTRGVTNHGLSLIARGCPSLKALSLWNVSTVGDEGLSQIAQGCHSLEKLDIFQCPFISSKGLIAIAENCPNLKVLNLESCTSIGDQGLLPVGKLCPKLQSISLKNCPLIGDCGICNLFITAPSLAKVKLQSLNIKDISLCAVGHYGKAVTSLILSSLQKVSEMGFWVMGKAFGLQKLVSLTISSCRGMTDTSIGSLGNGCANLKQIFLHKCCLISDKGLEAFVKAAGCLESLQLEECNRISQMGIIGTLSNNGNKLKSLSITNCAGLKELELGLPMPLSCESLRSLSIHYCPGVGSSGLAVMGKLCPQLKHLDLSGLRGITDDSLLAFLENCETGLEKVYLPNCFSLTDEALMALSRLHGRTIKHLNLDGCTKVTDASLVAIAENCFLLEDLDLSKSAITDSGVSILSTAELFNLKVLSISGCSNVTPQSKPFLLKLGKTLLGLNLQNCNSIGTHTVDQLMESLMGCDILY